MRRVGAGVVLFDLDGTLIDSAGIILASMRHATREVLAREISDSDLMAAVGGPGLAAQMHALGGARHVDALVEVYRAHNEPLHAGLEVFPGIERVLDELARRGCRLGVVSAKRRATIELAFSATGLGPRFDVVVGGDEAEGQKPEPDLLLLALERLGAPPHGSAYVGDSPFDMLAARRGGLRAVGVTWGRVHAREALADADLVVERPEELLAAL
jgi:pyrophosphatase PpaX